MQITCASSLRRRHPADIFVVPVWQGNNCVDLAVGKKDVPEEALIPIQHGDVSGKEGEITLVYGKESPEPRIFLLGLGDKKEVSVETLRRAYGALVKECICKKNCQKWHLLLPLLPKKREEERIYGVVEGILLPNYFFYQSTQEKKKETHLIKQVTLFGASKKEERELYVIQKTMEGVYLARDLVNGNADQITPMYLAKQAQQLAKQHGSVTAKILDKTLLEKEKLGLLLAVGRAGMHAPRLIILHYKGNPRSKDTTLLVGKGVTYDTGGLNLKPTGGMETMRTDMGGAAAVLGTIHALAALGIKVNVTGVIPACENAIDSQSFKPGDVYTGYAGITVEVGNTDAEGRLILADALAYGRKKFRPSRIIDLATLTGAAVVTFGTDVIALMSNDDKVARSLEESGNTTFERLWPLPLHREYREYLRSDIADICNIGSGRQAGTIIAGKFLEEFVGDTPWAHLDIAGKAFLSKPKRYIPQGGTGVGVRLLVDFFSRMKT